MRSCSSSRSAREVPLGERSLDSQHVGCHPCARGSRGGRWGQPGRLTHGDVVLGTDMSPDTRPALPRSLPSSPMRRIGRWLPDGGPRSWSSAVVRPHPGDAASRTPGPPGPAVPRRRSSPVTSSYAIWGAPVRAAPSAFGRSAVEECGPIEPPILESVAAVADVAERDDLGAGGCSPSSGSSPASPTWRGRCGGVLGDAPAWWRWAPACCCRTATPTSPQLPARSGAGRRPCAAFGGLVGAEAAPLRRRGHVALGVLGGLAAAADAHRRPGAAAADLWVRRRRWRSADVVLGSARWSGRPGVVARRHRLRRRRRLAGRAGGPARAARPGRFWRDGPRCAGRVGRSVLAVVGRGPRRRRPALRRALAPALAGYVAAGVACVPHRDPRLLPSRSWSPVPAGGGAPASVAAGAGIGPARCSPRPRTRRRPAQDGSDGRRPLRRLRRRLAAVVAEPSRRRTARRRRGRSALVDASASSTSRGPWWRPGHAADHRAGRPSGGPLLVGAGCRSARCRRAADELAAARSAGRRWRRSARRAPVGGAPGTPA